MDRVVVITNDDDITEAISQAIIKLNMEAVITSSYGAAKSELRAYPRPRLLIVDISYQQDISLKFIAHLRKESGFLGIPMLVLTDFPDPAVIKNALAAGANRYLTKSFIGYTFQQTIQSMLVGN